VKIFLDTNILISSFIFKGRVSKLLEELMQGDYELVVSEYVDDELEDKLNSKWSDKAKSVLDLYKNKIPIEHIKSTSVIENKIRDLKDNPVLADAVASGADILLTGDKDFFDVKIDKPIICSPSNVCEVIRTQR